MPRQRFTGGRSRQQNERMITRSQRRFDGGQAKKLDTLSTDLPTNAVAELENARGHRTFIQGRGGSELFTCADITLTIPSVTTQTLTYAMQQTDGLLYVANGNAVPDIGDVFRVTSVNDLDTQPLGVAKGVGAMNVHPDDLFEVIDNTNGSEEIKFLGMANDPVIPGYGDVSADEYTASKSGNVITLSGGPVNASLAGTFFVWDDGSRDYITKYLTSSTLQADNSDARTASSYGYFTAPLVASIYHKSQQKLVAQFGREVFVSDAPSKGWTRVLCESSTQPGDKYCRMWEDRETVVLINEAGVYRVRLDVENFYMWRMNEAVPTVKPTFDTSDSSISAEKGEPFPYIYRYLYSLTKFFLPNEEAPMNLTRLDSEKGMIVGQEGGPTKIDGNSIDYAEVNSRFPVGPVYNEDTGVSDPDYDNLLSLIEGNATAGDISVFTNVSDASLGVRFDDQAGGDILYNVVVDLTGTNTLGEVAARVQAACRTHEELAFLEVTYGETQYFPGVKTERFYFAWGEPGFSESLIGVEAASPAYGTDISGTGFLDVAGISPDYKNVMRNIKVLDIEDENNYSATHISVWRSRDAGENGQELGVNPEIFAYAGDIPRCKAFKVQTTDAVALGRLFSASEGVLALEDYGSTISLYDSGGGALAEGRLTQNLSNPDSYYGSPVDFGIYGTDMLAVIGSDTIMEGSQSGTTITISKYYKIVRDLSGGDADTIVDLYALGVGLSDVDVGKPIYWSNGKLSWIKSVTSFNVAEALSAEDHDDGASGDIACTMNPTKRSFNDSTDDDDLLDRLPYFPLVNRFWQELPENGVGVILPGYLFVAKPDERIFYYSQLGTGNGVYAGYYNPGLQVNDALTDVIVGFERQNDILFIKTKRGTYRVNVATAFEAGNAALGESAFVFPDPEVVDESVGFDRDGQSAPMENDAIFMFTNEQGVRVLQGEAFSKNLAVDRVQNSEIQRLEPDAIVAYDANLGAIVWGRRAQ